MKFLRRVHYLNKLGLLRFLCFSLQPFRVLFNAYVSVLYLFC